MVTMRSLCGMKLDSTLSMVVLPLPVPPEISTFKRPRTIALSSRAMAGVNAPTWIRLSVLSRSTAKRRIDMLGPSMASGGIIALTREPSLSRASTNGEDSSIRRPRLETMRSMMFSKC
ncbi:hypothetical protein D3C71_1145180 [compost metagenome]